MTCRCPDVDCPKLLCGYPMPCPHHTAVIDVDQGEVRILFTAKAALRERERLRGIGKALTE